MMTPRGQVGCLLSRGILFYNLIWNILKNYWLRLCGKVWFLNDKSLIELYVDVYLEIGEMEWIVTALGEKWSHKVSTLTPQLYFPPLWLHVYTYTIARTTLIHSA